MAFLLLSCWLEWKYTSKEEVAEHAERGGLVDSVRAKTAPTPERDPK
jgi:hypothetical protein